VNNNGAYAPSAFIAVQISNVVLTDFTYTATTADTPTETFHFHYTSIKIQRTIYYGQYKRTKSFFPNSDFGADGAPTAQELAILEPYKDQLDPRILEKAFEPPQTDGSGRNREQVRQALQLFREAGWELKDSKLMKDGKQMKIEFLLVQPDMERVVAPYQQNLQRAGIDASIRIVDSSQYRVRLDDFDFDIITVRSNFFPPPGPELRSYYGSAAADVRGSANWPGIKNPVVDALIEQIIAAKDLDTLKATTRAMDRVLLWNFYVIPQLHNDTFRVAYWNKFGHPDKFPRYGTGFSGTWWIDAALAAKLPKR
jgi:microcin C transport system substrate-binding protein